MGIRVPKAIAEQVQLRTGSEVEFDTSNGVLTIRPVSRRRSLALQGDHNERKQTSDEQRQTVNQLVVAMLPIKTDGYSREDEQVGGIVTVQVDTYRGSSEVTG